MNPASLLRGKGTFTVGWSAVVLGFFQLAQLAGQLLAQGATSCLDILGPVLHSDGLLIMLAGFATVFFRRAQDSNTEKLKEHLSEKVEQQVPDMLKRLLAELETRKEPK